MGAAAKLKVLIVDDEPPARERLRSLLAEIADVEERAPARVTRQCRQCVARILPRLAL